MKFISIALLSTAAVTASCNISECLKTDINCIARCLNVPNPTQEQAQDATDCNSQCFVDNNATTDCFINCVKDVFLRDRPSTSHAATSVVASSSKSASSDSASQSTSTVLTTSISTSTKTHDSTVPVTSKSSSRGLPHSDSKDESQAMTIASSSFAIIISALSYLF